MSKDQLVIVFVIDIYDGGKNGTSASARRTAEYLRRRGHQVRVISTGLPEADKFLVPVKSIPVVSAVAAKQNFIFAQPVEDTLRAAFNGADIVHLFLPMPLEIKALAIAQEMGIPCSAAFHLQPENITYNIHQDGNEVLVNFVYNYFYKSFYHAFSHIHCPSNFIAGQLRQHGYPAQLHVISNGIPAAFQPSSSPNGRAHDTFQILSVGRLAPEKRHDLLIEAVTLSRHRQHIQLHIAGDGPCREHLVKQGQSLPLPPTFGYYQQNELIALAQSCDLYAHPSDVEIEAIACLEAIACGLVPVISNSKRSATPQFALDERSLFQAGSAADLAARIDYWIEDIAERAHMSREYAKSAQGFSLDECSLQMEAMFHEVIGDEG
jgi:glycosyltransferase involved in cell wall biosynthesis